MEKRGREKMYGESGKGGDQKIRKGRGQEEKMKWG